MAVNDIYRVDTFMELEEGGYSFRLFYRETVEPTGVRPPDQLLKVWFAGMSLWLLNCLSFGTRVETQRAVRVLPARGIPAQSHWSLPFGSVPGQELTMPCAARFYLRSALPSRARPMRFDLSGVPTAASYPVTFLTGFYNLALSVLASNLAEPLAVPGFTGAWQLQHMARSIPNGVNTYGSPSDVSFVAADPRPRAVYSRKLARKGPVLPVP